MTSTFFAAGFTRKWVHSRNNFVFFSLKGVVRFTAKLVSTIRCFIWPFWHLLWSEGHQQGPEWRAISGYTTFQKIRILWKVMVMVYKPQVPEVRGIRTIFMASLDFNWCSGVFTLEVSDWGQSFNASGGSRHITHATFMFYGVLSSTFSFWNFIYSLKVNLILVLDFSIKFLWIYKKCNIFLLFHYMH